MLFWQHLQTIVRRDPPLAPSNVVIIFQAEAAFKIHETAAEVARCVLATTPKALLIHVLCV